MNPVLHAIDKGHIAKLKYLLEFSEDEFRDQCVRPLMKKMGMSYYCDLCGVDEEGKDAILIGHGPLKEEVIYAIQTKKGKITMAVSANEDLTTALRQMRLAAETPVHLPWSKRRARPDKVYLVASGEINDKARRYITNEINESHLVFWDANDLIPLLDKHYEEFWHGIDANRFPYLRGLIVDLISRSDIILSQDTKNPTETAIPITDDVYVPLYLSRIKREVKKEKGKLKDKAVFIELESEAVLRQRERQVLVLGEGGAGKSTLLRRLAYDTARRALDLQEQDKKRLPVLFRATELARGEEPLIDLCFQKTRDIANSQNCCILPEDTTDGSLLVLIDALDEVSTDSDKERVIAKINDFTKEYRQNTVILTSREVSALQTLNVSSHFAIYRVNPIRIKEAAKIVDRVVEGIRGDLDETGREMLQAQSKEILRRLQDVHGVELSPFLVTIFVASEDFDRKDIPPNITEIIKKFTEQMLGRWDQKKGISQQFEYGLKDYLVCLVAFKMHSDRVTRLSIGEFSKLLESGLNRMGKGKLAGQVFQEVVFRSGLFYVEDGEVSFKNHVFQEFFAGRGVTSHADFAEVLHDEWWSKPVMFYFGEDPRRHEYVHDLTKYPVAKTWLSAYTTAVTVGLALQCSYFSDEAKKLETLEWVVKLLSESFLTFLSSDGKEQFPLNAFLYHFLGGRDAVATDMILNMTPVVTKRKGLAFENEKLDPVQELHEFWRLVGLLEANCIDDAKVGILQYQPDDQRLLLALQLSVALIVHFRVVPKTTKKTANEILSYLNPKVVHLAAAVMKEYGSILFELRQGHTVAIDAPLTTPAGQFEMTF